MKNTKTAIKRQNNMLNWLAIGLLVWAFIIGPMFEQFVNYKIQVEQKE